MIIIINKQPQFHCCLVFADCQHEEFQLNVKTNRMENVRFVLYFNFCCPVCCVLLIFHAICDYVIATEIGCFNNNVGLLVVVFECTQNVSLLLVSNPLSSLPHDTQSMTPLHSFNIFLLFSFHFFFFRFTHLLRFTLSLALLHFFAVCLAVFVVYVLLFLRVTGVFVSLYRCASAFFCNYYYRYFHRMPTAACKLIASRNGNNGNNFYLSLIEISMQRCRLRAHFLFHSKMIPQSK